VISAASAIHAEPVGDVAEHEQRRVGPDDLRDLLGVTPVAGSVSIHRTGQPALGGDPLDDVAVGREVVGVDDDLAPAGLRVDGRPDELVEQHRRRVGDDDLAGAGPERRAPSRSPRRAATRATRRSSRG
jgi:hypothetical protein